MKTRTLYRQPARQRLIYGLVLVVGVIAGWHMPLLSKYLAYKRVARAALVPFLFRELA